jgi:hypothetical protein
MSETPRGGAARGRRGMAGDRCRRTSGDHDQRSICEGPPNRQQPGRPDGGDSWNRAHHRVNRARNFGLSGNLTGSSGASSLSNMSALP